MNWVRNNSWITRVALFLVAGCVTACGYPLSFTLEFPTSSDLGELWLVEDVNCFTCGAGEKHLGRATGSRNIYLPAAHWFVSLRMPKNASELLPHLAHPSLSNIGDVNLEGSDVKDEGLKYIAHLNLRSINLNRTQITGAGLRYLRPNEKWIFVDLRGCEKLDLKYLVHFKGWKRSTVSVVGYKWGEKNTDQEKRLLEVANHVICDNQPENVCGTQIR